MVKTRKSKGGGGTVIIETSPVKLTPTKVDLSSTEIKPKTNGIAKSPALVNGNGYASHEKTNDAHNHVVNGKSDGELIVSSTPTRATKKEKDLTMKERLAKTEESIIRPTVSQGDSMAVLLTQGLMANDAEKTDAVLSESNLSTIHATINDLQVTNVIPLLKAIEHRLRTRNTIEIRPWIRWAQCVFSAHMSYLTSQRNLEKELGGLLDWMRTRVGHQQKLLALHGKMSIIAEQIERRSNKSLRIAPQPLILFNNDEDDDSDIDDLESIHSDDSGASSQDEWWDDNLLEDKEDGQEEEEDDDDSEDERRSRKKKRVEEESEDDSDVEVEAMDDGDDDDDDDEDDEDMEEG